MTEFRLSIVGVGGARGDIRSLERNGQIASRRLLGDLPIEHSRSALAPLASAMAASSDGSVPGSDRPLEQSSVDRLRINTFNSPVAARASPRAAEASFSDSTSASSDCTSSEARHVAGVEARLRRIANARRQADNVVRQRDATIAAD